MSFETDERWSLTQPALETLLRRLADDPGAAAREYEAVRRKLIGFFARRGAQGPDALADVTMDRVARKLDAGENVESIRGYLYGVAKRVMLESVKERGLEREAREQSRPAPADDAGEPSEARIDCLRRCLRRLPAPERTLIRAYYAGQASRRRLAEALSISYTTLKTRAHRIRSRLGECLQDCLKAQGDP